MFTRSDFSNQQKRIIEIGSCEQDLIKGMATYENSYKNRSQFFNFRVTVYLFDRDVAYLISLNMANLNNRKINRKGY